MEEYKIYYHIFKGKTENGAYIYEIGFNKSLDNTLRMNGMCEGLDARERNNDNKLSFWSKLKELFR